MPINKRNLAVSIILTIVTCGIYGIYWFIVMTDDTKNVSGDINGASGGVAFLLTLVTFMDIIGLTSRVRELIMQRMQEEFLQATAMYYISFLLFLVCILLYTYSLRIHLTRLLIMTWIWMAAVLAVTMVRWMVVTMVLQIMAMVQCN